MFRHSTLVSSLEMRLRSGSDFLRNKIRVPVMGSEGTGKTSFVDHFVREGCVKEYRARDLNYPEAITRSKLITEFIVVRNKLNHQLRKLAIKQAHAFILVYSVDNQASFDHVCELKDQLQEARGENVPIIVIGNKNDVTDKEVHPVIADCVVTMDWELSHVVVSVKTGENMNCIHRKLLDELCKQNIVNYASCEPAPDIDPSTPPQQSSLLRRLSMPVVRNQSCENTTFRQRVGSGSKSKWVLIKTFFVGDKKESQE